MHRSASLFAVVVSSTLLVPSSTPAFDLADGKLSVGGNGSWAFLKTDRNSYLEANRDGEWATAMFDLLAIAKPTEDLVLSAQLGFEPVESASSAQTELEWAFAEYRVSDLLRVRAGKVKQPFGNYAELQFVGVSRPFYDLPTSVYGPANVTASSYSGVGVTGEWVRDGGFGVQYDIYGGALALKLYEPFFDYPPPAPPAVFTGTEVTEEVVGNLVGGRLSFATPWDVTLRLSGFGGRAERDAEKIRTLVYGASLFHRGEKVWMSIEAFQSVEGEEKQVSAYAEAAYFVTQKAQVAARYERCRMELGDPLYASVPSRLLDHDEVAAGLNWWFTPQVVTKVSVHEIWGSRFASSKDPLAVPKDRTLMLVAGTQFTF